MDADDPGFGIYVHWPFCAAKCPYCDFNSHVRQGIDHERWARALVQDLRHQARDIAPETVTSVFFGGGTPSLMAPGTVAAIIDAIADIFPVAADVEITLEANPTSVEAERFRGFASAGVNRVSLGIQALNDADLRRLGRMHTAAEARKAFDLAQAVFGRVSFDLIYARQDQTIAQWQSELSAALDMAADHLSLYQLTVEPDTRFGALYDAGKLRGLPGDDLSADMFDITQSMTADGGLPAYEVSNHARPGAECRHNLLYWQYGPYLGVGPGAHGRVIKGGHRHATEAERMPEHWLAQVDSTGCGTQVDSLLRDDEMRIEYLLMGLRLRTGVSLQRFSRVTGHDIDDPVIGELISQNYLVRTNTRLAVTDRGRPVLNALLREILT